jgi:hypothetical protein
MGIKQFQRGMRHRFKYIQLRLRLQVRHMAMHRKARQAGVACEAPPLPPGATDRSDGVASAQADTDVPHASLPTLRRSAKAAQ